MIRAKHLLMALIGLMACAAQVQAQAQAQAQAHDEAEAQAQARAQPETRFSATALYNAANAYAREGKTGLAVLNYERAGLLAPHDPDIEANLSFVRASKHLPADPPSGFKRAVTAASPTMLAWTGLLGVAIAGTCLLAGQVSPRHPWLRRAALAFGIALVALTVSNGVVLWPTLHDAVVLTTDSPVRVSPVPMGDPLFVLPEAETVSITAQHDEFVLVQTRAGKTGWMARANLAPVVPRGGDEPPQR